MADDITEFTEIDPEEMHLVGRSANGFETPLLAKGADRDMTMSVTHGADGQVHMNLWHEKPGKKGKKKMKKSVRKAVVTALAKSAHDGTLTKQAAATLIEESLTRTKKAADEALADGDVWRAQAIMRDRTLLKMELGEMAHERRGRIGPLGPGSRRLVTNRRALPDDPGISYQ